MKETKINFNLDGLEELKRNLGAQYITRVGILGAHAARTGEGKFDLNNATLGLIQIYGSIANNIPSRDFLIMPIETKRREILKILSSNTARAAFANKDYKRLYGILGAAAVGFVDEAFASGGFGTWAPNKPTTVAHKGSSAPLIDTGELRKSVTFDVVPHNYTQLPSSRQLKALPSVS